MRNCQTLRSVPLKSFYTGFRTKAREFVGKTAICRFVESQIGWGKFLIGGVKGGKSHQNLTAEQAAISN